jgi:hypothetical protein
MDSDPGVQGHTSGLQEGKQFLTEGLSEPLDFKLVVKALDRISKEHLDINWFEAGTFVKGAVWAALDREMCTEAMDISLLGLLRKLATVPEKLAELMKDAKVNPDDL